MLYSAQRIAVISTVFIEGLKVETVIGVYEWEKSILQTLVLDIEMAFDFSKAITSDKLEHTLNYAAVADYCQDFAKIHRFELIEAFSGNLAQELRDKFSLPWIKMIVRKPTAVANSLAVGLTLEFGERL